MPPYIDGYYSNSITNPVFPPNLFTQSDGFPYLWLDVLPETNVARWMRLESNLAGDIVPRYYCNHVDSTDPPLRFDLDNPPLPEECFPGLQAQMSISEESRVTGIPILVYDNDGNVAASLSCMNADETLSQYWVLDSDPLTGRATLTWLDEEGAGAISGTFDPATNRFRFSSHEPPERSFDSGGVTFFTQFSETIEGLYDVGTQTISGTWRVRDTNSWTLSDGTVSCSAILSFEGDVLAGAP